jgi:hypothetical protein
VLPCQALSQKGLGVSAKACLPLICWSDGKRFGMNVVGKAQGFSPIGIIAKKTKKLQWTFFEK